jgi:Ca-activated chloride channel homolog
MNSKGFPDTLVIDPLSSYRIHVHTVPPVFIDSVGQTAGKHTTTGVDAPQGYLRVKFGNPNTSAKPPPVIVRKQNEMATLNVQYFEKTERYITGNYDLEILTLPRTYVERVNVKQSHTTDVVIPNPGLVIIHKATSGYGSLYLEEKNNLVWVCNLEEQSFNETLYLQPGNYRVVFRSRSSNRAMYSVERSFSVESESTSRVNIYQ